MKIYFNKLIESKITGLQCDTEDCNYTDTTIHVQDLALYVNAPCPKCGESLLTGVDFRIVKFALRLEKLFGWIRVPSFKPSRWRRFAMDGSGKIKREECPRE